MKESRLWDRYMDAYQHVLRETSRDHAPWYAIPADDKPFMRATVADIVERSGLSVGAFYQRFDNKAALLTMVHTRHIDNLLVQIATIPTERAAGRDIVGVLRLVVVAGVRGADREGRFQAACFRAALADPEFAAREYRTRRALAAGTHPDAVEVHRPRAHLLG